MKFPILKLGQVLHTSIPEELTDEDALSFTEHVLDTVSQTEAIGIVIDISAMDTVDSFTARLFNDTANMLQLIGAQVVLCGMSPYVALTLVEMGRQLIGVRTALNLEHGVAVLNQILRDRS